MGAGMSPCVPRVPRVSRVSRDTVSCVCVPVPIGDTGHGHTGRARALRPDTGHGHANRFARTPSPRRVNR